MKIFQLALHLKYALLRRYYIDNLPGIPGVGQLALNSLNYEGVFVTSLEELAFQSTPNLLKASSKILSDLDKSTYESSSNQVITLTSNLAVALWGLEERLLKLADSYLGLPTLYHGVQLFKNFPSKTLTDPQLWHRDVEDYRMIKIIVYLNDVNETGGPFEYIPKHLTPSLLTFARKFKNFPSNGLSLIQDEELAKIVPKSSWKACLGEAGTVVIADTRNILHRGRPPERSRSALFFSYTSKFTDRLDVCKTNFGWNKESISMLSSQLTPVQRSYLPLN